MVNLLILWFVALLPSAMSVSGGHRPLLSFLEAAKVQPVTKVVNLLKDMQKQLEKEAEEDEEVYDKMACWCETNDKEKTKAIADAEAKINDLTASIEELSAASASLNAQIKNLAKEVAENQEALEQATAMRAKELAEFNSEEKDTLLSIAALKSAIIVLSKNHEGAASFTQASSKQIFEAAQVINHQLANKAAMLEGVLSREDRESLISFVQSPSYAPASGQILGILKQMKETFESNIANSQKEELTNQKMYEELKASKEEEIAAGQGQVETKTQELADTDEKLAADKKDMEDTKAGLAADEEFLMTLKTKCQGVDQEYEERQKTRKLEIEAVTKAIAFLSSDEARDLFSKTLSPAFVQVKSMELSRRQFAASKLLSDIARQTRSPRLMTLALKAKLNPFTKVKKAIDDMIQQLLKEKQDEIKLKDFCRESKYENEMNQERKEREKKDFMKVIDELEAKIGMLEKAIETLKAEVAEMNTQLDRAGEDREKQNKEFQMTVADQRATVKLLNQALKVLEGFYGKKAKAMALEQAVENQAPPPGFKEQKPNAASGGVMGMIQTIIDDAKALEEEATRAEAESQKTYEDFVKETQASVDEKNKDIVGKSEEKAKAEEDKTTNEQNKENAMLELEQLGNEMLDLKKKCDFVVENFDIRQSARDEEIEGLKKAKAILSGAKFIQYLQTILD